MARKIREKTHHGVQFGFIQPILKKNSQLEREKQTESLVLSPIQGHETGLSLWQACWSREKTSRVIARGGGNCGKMRGVDECRRKQGVSLTLTNNTLTRHEKFRCRRYIKGSQIEHNRRYIVYMVTYEGSNATEHEGPREEETDLSRRNEMEEMEWRRYSSHKLAIDLNAELTTEFE